MIVDDEQRYNKLPDLIESAVRVDHIPGDLTVVARLHLHAFAVAFLCNIVDHHLLQVALGHALETRLEAKSVSEAASLGPEVSRVGLALLLGHRGEVGALDRAVQDSVTEYFLTTASLLLGLGLGGLAVASLGLAACKLQVVLGEF